MNLSLYDENKDVIASTGVIQPMDRELSSGTSSVKENAVCMLSQAEELKAEIGRARVIPPLVKLLETGGLRSKKDVSTVLYSLYSTMKENKVFLSPT